MTWPWQSHGMALPQLTAVSSMLCLYRESEQLICSIENKLPIQTIFPTQPNPIVDNVEIEKYTNVETVKSSRKIEGEKGKRSPGKRWQLHPWLRLPCFEPVQPRCPLLRLPDQPCWKGWSWRRPCSPRSPRETLWPSPTWPLSLSLCYLKRPMLQSISKKCKCLEMDKMISMSLGSWGFRSTKVLQIPWDIFWALWCVSDLPARETALQSCWLRLPTSQLSKYVIWLDEKCDILNSWREKPIFNPPRQAIKLVGANLWSL